MSEPNTEHLYVLLKRAVRALERLEEFGLADTRASLRPPHVPVLAALLEADQLTPGEIAARCHIEPSTLTGLLRTLEKEGLLAREYLVHDERTYAVVLTARGRAASRVAVRARAWAQTVVVDEIGADAFERIAPLLRQMTVVAEQAAQSDSAQLPTTRRPAGNFNP